MILRLVVLASTGATALVCAVSSEVILNRVVDEVNACLPQGARYSPDWWHAPKYMRVIREYRRLYPSGSRIDQLRFRSLLMAVSVACSALAVGFDLVLVVWLGTGGCLLAWMVHRNWQAQ